MTRATSTAAASFLDKLQAEMAFAVTTLQVDGGSKFMADFETACQAKQLPLFVLPPRSPELNGAVERANGSWRSEFYAVYDFPGALTELNPLIDSFQHLYNHFRPHGVLHGLTPRSISPPTTARSPNVSNVLNQDTRLTGRGGGLQSVGPK